jgi:MFS family permease
MGTLRWIVGFVTFLLAFALRGEDTSPQLGAVTGRAVAAPGAAIDLGAVAPSGAPPVWHFGVVVAVTGIGGLVGAGLAPMLRRRVEEEYLLLAAVVVACLAGLSGLLLSGLPGQALMAFLVAIAASSGKQAFDAVVQRDAPDANRGRSFARFESRFQVIWVLGAAVPVVIAMSTQLGGAIVAALAAAAGVFFFTANQAVQRGEAPRRLPDARTISRQVRQRRRRITDRDPGSPESRS